MTSVRFPLPGSSGPYSQTLLELVRTYWADSNPGAADGEWARHGVEMLNARRAAEAFCLVQRSVPFPLAGKRLLEIGSGVGAFVLHAREQGVDAYGVESTEAGTRVAERLFDENGRIRSSIGCAVGEHLPFGTATFDVVCSLQVLEHVRDPAQVLAETLRVLNVGGYFVHIFPNYGSFWEGHYGILWVPHLPKWAARLYLRLLGEPTDMLDELQLVSQQRVSRMLARHSDVKIIDWGTSLWEYRVRTLDFSEWAHLHRVKRALRLLHRLRLVSLGIAIGKAAHFETPVVLVGTKVRPPPVPRRDASADA